MVDRGKSKVQSPKSKVGPHCLFFVLLSSLFTLLLIAGCPGEDLTPPEVAIILPADGDSIAGTTTIRARATDNKVVDRVEFFVDAARVGIDTTPAGPIFEFAWTPVGLLPGTSHALRCFATDAAGNRNSSAPVNVYISAAAGTHHAGTIATNETWSIAGSPHIVDADLAVEAFLTVEPGVIVLVADGATIAVGTRAPAGLKAQGKTDSAITFTALNPTSGPGAWGGIHYRANAVPNNNVLRHCTIEYAGRDAGALVRCDAGATVIDSCSLRASSSRGVTVTGDGLRSLTNTKIADCAGYPVSMPAGRVSSIGAGNTLTGNSRNAIELTGGTIAASDTWANHSVPYCITATVTVADSSNPLLTIAAGCSLLFGDSAALRVGVGRPGGLRADGTYGRIVFAPLAASPGPGDWRGIEFWEKTDPARTMLNYCRVEGAGAGNTPAITCYSVPVTITNTRIAGNAGSGVYCYNTGFTRFENDTITTCAGVPLHIAAQHVSTIGNGNSFTGNGQPGIEVTGGAITRDAQYRRQNVPYRITGTIDVGSQYEPALIIETGVVLQFDPGAGLTVGLNSPGRLQAVGAPDSITFTAVTTQPGAWRGLELHRYASSSSRLERCRLLYGGGASRGILFIDSCMPVVTGNEIAWSSNYCVYVVNSEIDPDTLRVDNWLHDWAPGFDDIYYEPFSPNGKPDRGSRSGTMR
jgi:hypothetical protein